MLRLVDPFESKILQCLTVMIRPREMVQWLQELTALVDDPDLVSRAFKNV